MNSLFRKSYQLASNRLSNSAKRQLKAIGRRVVPPGGRRRLKYVVRRARSETFATAERRAARERVRQFTKDVSSMSNALWIGFEKPALADLERVRRSEGSPLSAVTRACETLARWHATNGNHDVALERVVHLRTLNGQRQPERLRVLEHHLLTELGHFAEAQELFDRWGTASPDLHLMQANLWLRQAQAGVLSHDEADRERRELIDWVFRRRELTPLDGLLTGTGVTFDALDARPPGSSDSAGRLSAADRLADLSIVVPAYNAASTLATSVNSLRRQSHEALEIIIVDDASSDDTLEIANELAAVDTRIVVIRHERNQGAYGARNTGLYAATGDYFTVHDADDWSHPQLIERQLALLKARNATGSFSRLARVTPDMRFLLRPYRPMLEPIHWNYTSLLVSSETLRDFGGWDTVRAHADSDLIERLREHFGRDCLVEADTDVPLSFFSVSGDNLTERSDTGLRSVDFGARKEYTEQARYWRRTTVVAGEVPTLDGHRRSGAKTPFFAARSLSPNRDSISRSYDVIIGSDLALTGGTRRCNLAYVDCALELGLKVGIFNAPRYRLKGSGTVDDTYRELFQRENVDLLTPDDRVSAQTLIVHHPPVLRQAFTAYPRISAEQHYILVNQLPWEMSDFTRVQYEVPEVQNHYREAFGARAQWIPISPKVRRYLAGLLPAEDIYDEDWYPVVNWNASVDAVRTTTGSRQPIVGRHSRDHATKWPEAADALEGSYLAGTEYEVRLLGGASAAERVLGYRPTNWVVYPFDTLSAQQFLIEIDFFAHFHHSLYIEEFGRNISEAMALGVPCLLPPDYEETFGDAAAYCEPQDVAETVQTLWNSAGRYREYSERGVRFVQENCSIDAGMRRLKRAMG